MLTRESKLNKSAHSTICAPAGRLKVRRRRRILLLALLCAPLSPAALAQLTAIGPGTPDVTESVLTLVPSSPPTSPPSFVPKLTPLQAGEFGGGYMIGPDVGFTFGPGTAGCLLGCPGDPQTPQTFRMLDVHFDNPVSFVSALQTSIPSKDALIIAYNSANQEVGLCEGAAGSAAPPPGACYSVISEQDATSALVRYTITTGSNDISTLLVGGDIFDPINKVETVQFAFSNAPEPDTFGLLTLALAGMGITRLRRAAAVRVTVM